MEVWILVYLLITVIFWCICFATITEYHLLTDSATPLHTTLKQVIASFWVAIFWPISFIVINLYCLFIIVKDEWEERD